MPDAGDAKALPDAGDAGTLPDADEAGVKPDAGEPPAPPPPDESGFFDVPPRPDADYPARLFYVFLKSDVNGAPLVVFSNGGPGVATSFGLLAYGTARAAVTASGAVEPNPGNWTSFANLLYIDERQSGFSYGLDAGSSSYYNCNFDPRADAADFVRGLLDFLDGHPALTASPVVIAAESYGGTRATYMLDLLLRYRSEAPLVDKSLADRIQQHYDLVFPGHATTTIVPGLAAQQFGSEVLIQPLLGGQMQYDTENQLMPSDPWLQKYPQPHDAYDVRKPLGWSDTLDGMVATALADPASSEQLFGIDVALVPRIGPADRAGAFRTPSLYAPDPAVTALNASLASRVGALASGDAYVRQPAVTCADAPSIITVPGGAFQIFADNLRYARTFITRARYDSVVYSPSIPYLFAQAGYGGVVDNAPRPGVARPGWFEVSLPASSSGPAKHVEVRFPPYDAGHMVALGDGVHLRDDLAAWLATAP